MNCADPKTWTQELVEGLSKNLKGNWGKDLCQGLMEKINQLLVRLFVQSMSQSQATALAGWSKEKIGEALTLQFAQGLPQESQQGLQEHVLAFLAKSLRARKEGDDPFAATTRAATKAVADWAAGIAEELTKEFLDLLTQNQEGTPQLIEEKKAKPKAKSKKAKPARAAKPKTKAKKSPAKAKRRSK
jgi:hypothetical protein